MSGSSSEKLREDTASLDDDSGHDSVDDINNLAADERERIASLETAVAWIREEVVSAVRHRLCVCVYFLWKCWFIC